MRIGQGARHRWTEPFLKGEACLLFSGSRWGIFLNLGKIALSRVNEGIAVMDSSPPLLAGVAVVLVRPETPGNVGAVARIIRNFGLGQLRIVGEPLHESADARRVAHRSHDVLAAAAVFDDLPSAFVGCRWSVGASGRRGHNARRGNPPVAIRSAAARLAHQAARSPGAIVFGPESDGLSLTDLARCDEIVRIPQRTPGPSLNLAQAVAVVGAELFQAALIPGGAPPPELAPCDDVHRLARRLSRVARHCGLTVRNRPEQFDESVRQVLAGHSPTTFELSVLERWLAQVEWFVGLSSSTPQSDS